MSRNDNRFIFDSILSSEAERVTSSPGIGIAACSAFLAASIVASSVAGACCKTYCLIDGLRPVLMASRKLLSVKTAFVLSMVACSL